MLLGKLTESDILAFAEDIVWSYSSDGLFDEGILWDRYVCYYTNNQFKDVEYMLSWVYIEWKCHKY